MSEYRKVYEGGLFFITLTVATVANKEVPCSDLTELMKEYELVLKYKNQKTDMKCLE